MHRIKFSKDWYAADIVFYYHLKFFMNFVLFVYLSAVVGLIQRRLKRCPKSTHYFLTGKLVPHLANSCYKSSLTHAYIIREVIPILFRLGFLCCVCIRAGQAPVKQNLVSNQPSGQSGDLHHHLGGPSGPCYVGHSVSPP